MIKRIELQNFQSHEKARLDLGQCTILTGMSSSGKTSVIRGLEWLLYGDWDKTYPMDDDKPTAVALELDDGIKIMRMRKDGENLAVVVKDGQTYKYRAFGNTIPGIFDILNMRVVKMGTREVNMNFSHQDEPPFLLSDSRPARAQWLGRLYGAHVISAMLRLMNSDKREADKKSRGMEEDLKSVDERLVEFEGIELQERALGKAKTLMDHLEILADIRESALEVKTLDAQLADHRWLVNIDLDAIRARVGSLEHLGHIKESATEIKILDEQIVGRRWLAGIDFDAIRVRVGSLEHLGHIKKSRGELQDLSKTVEDGRWLLQADLNGVRSLVAELKVLRVLQHDFTDLKYEDQEVLSRKKAVDPELKRLRAKVKKDLFKGGRCPLCDSKPKKISADTIASRARQLIGG